MTTTNNLENFRKALAFVLHQEGRYVNDPDDLGGETNYGITHLTYNNYRKFKNLPPQSVKLISQTEVSNIYYNNYWLLGGCDLLPIYLGLIHFDWCVNHGTIGAIKTLQKVVGVNADGIIGTQTKTAIQRAVANQGEKTLCGAYLIIRENYYRNIVLNSPSQSKYLKGWLNRLSALKKETI